MFSKNVQKDEREFFHMFDFLLVLMLLLTCTIVLDFVAFFPRLVYQSFLTLLKIYCVHEWFRYSFFPISFYQWKAKANNSDEKLKFENSSKNTKLFDTFKICIKINFLKSKFIEILIFSKFKYFFESFSKLYKILNPSFTNQFRKIRWNLN